MIQTIVSSVEAKVMPKLPTLVNVTETMDLSASSDEEEDMIYTINDLLMERARTIPEEPLVGYPASARGAGDYVYYNAKDLNRFADGAAKTLIDQGLPTNVTVTPKPCTHLWANHSFRILRMTARLWPCSAHQILTMSSRSSVCLAWDMAFFFSQLD